MKIELFIAGGYSGGHTSQRNWDMDKEDNSKERILKRFPHLEVKTYSNMGNTSGYYPSVVIVNASEEELAVINELLNVVTY
jgi:hypothetical protein